MKNIINKIKNKLEAINSRLGEAELISNLEETVMESNQVEQEKKGRKRIKMRTGEGNSVT